MAPVMGGIGNFIAYAIDLDDTLEDISIIQSALLPDGQCVAGVSDGPVPIGGVSTTKVAPAYEVMDLFDFVPTFSGAVR